MHCLACEYACAFNLIIAYETFIDIDIENCTECRACIEICPVGALEVK